MISLCIPTYNRLSYLKECLHSIIDGFGDYRYEVIVADGGSTDGTLEYIKELDNNHIILIEQGELTGITKAYNASFKIAKGDYIFIGNDDITIVPEVFIKACKLMDTEKNIGFVGLKVQEPRHGNLTGVSLNTNYGVLMSHFHIFRRSVLIDEMKYFDENFRSYRIDDDSSLAVLNLGYAIIFTKEFGLIHHRALDENENKARSINKQESNFNTEFNYFNKKWMPIQKNVEKYLNNKSFTRKKSNLFKRTCAKIYYTDILATIFPKRLYDIFLERIIYFKDKNYDHLNDFYLAQKYPDDIYEI